MLSGIAAALGGKLFESFFGNARGALKDYQDRKISEAELATRLKEAFLSSFTQVETAHADLTARTFEAFQATLRQSPMMQKAWCWVVYSQLAVLLWHQVGIPAFVKVFGGSYPSSGSTVEWSYALIGFMFGAGAMLLRAGPGTSGGLIDSLKKVIWK
jgi:hypothetical protein